MKLIICVDKKMGMSLFGKRQSKDSVLCEKLMSMAENSKIYMNSYTAKLFDKSENVCVSEDFLSVALNADYCFVENTDFKLDNVDEVVLCNWNRHYPADKFFDLDLEKNGFTLKSTENIKGSSHDKITLSVYARQI